MLLSKCKVDDQANGQPYQKPHPIGDTQLGHQI